MRMSPLIVATTNCTVFLAHAWQVYSYEMSSRPCGKSCVCNRRNERKFSSSLIYLYVWLPVTTQTMSDIIWAREIWKVRGSTGSTMLRSTLASILNWSHYQRMAHQSGSPLRVTRCCCSVVGEKAQPRNSRHSIDKFSMSGSGSVFRFLRLAKS